MANFTKIADLTVKDGTYMKEGRELNRYQNIGCILSTPHGSQMFIKLNATATSDSRSVNIFPVEGVKITVTREGEQGSAPAEPAF